MTKFKETLDTKELRLNVVSSKTQLDLVVGYFYTGNMDYSSFGPSDLFDIQKLTSYMNKLHGTGTDLSNRKLFDPRNAG